MKKSLIATAGVAAFGFAALPVLGVFAGTSSVTDEIEVTIPDSCTLLSETTDTASGATETSNKYTATMANGEVRSDIGGTDADTGTAGANVLSIACNTTDASKNTWKLTAIGGEDGTLTSGGDTTMTPSVAGNTPIATGTATSGDDSQWAMKVTGNGVTIQNSFNAWHVVPAAPTEVASGSGSVTDAFTMTYQVYISPTQESDTYTGHVTYTLTNPNS